MILYEQYISNGIRNNCLSLLYKMTLLCLLLICFVLKSITKPHFERNSSFNEQKKWKQIIPHNNVHSMRYKILKCIEFISRILRSPASRVIMKTLIDNLGSHCLRYTDASRQYGVSKMEYIIYDPVSDS